MKTTKTLILVSFLFLVIAALIILFWFNRNSPAQKVTTTPNPAASTTPVGVEELKVAGMSKFTDPDFGFSFWYPSLWNVTEVKVLNKKIYPDGTVLKQLLVTNGQREITLEEFTSPTFSITDSTGVGACPVCNTIRYYFDVTKHIWMTEFPNGSDAEVSAYPKPANISVNTMGGLHMFYGSKRFGANVIIPLSASHFVVVSVDGAIATGSDNAQALTKTITAIDPSVATPLNPSEQIQIIQTEAEAFSRY